MRPSIDKTHFRTRPKKDAKKKVNSFLPAAADVAPAQKLGTLVFGVPTYRKYDLLAKLIVSVKTSSRPADKIVVVDNGGAFNTQYKGPKDGVTVVRPGRNLGCAAAWNILMETATADTDTIVISNDDIVLTPHSLARIETNVHKNSEALIMAKDYALFAMTPAVWKKIGRFDEHFWPAYWEDVDYERRRNLAGMPAVRLLENVQHVVSATLKSLPPEERAQLMASYAKNQAYYAEKWGGPLGSEKFQTPFGSP